jgi:hypothetical protein
MGLLIAGGLSACRQAPPIVQNPARSTAALATINGTVQGPTSGVPARMVTVISESTGQRRSVLTRPTGGFTLAVPPGKYRVEVQLLRGERLLRSPANVEVAPGAIDGHVDFVVGLETVSRPRGPAYRVDNGLGSPIA